MELELVFRRKKETYLDGCAHRYHYVVDSVYHVRAETGGALCGSVIKLKLGCDLRRKPVTLECLPTCKRCIVKLPIDWYQKLCARDKMIKEVARMEAVVTAETAQLRERINELEREAKQRKDAEIRKRDQDYEEYRRKYLRTDSEIVEYLKQRREEDERQDEERRRYCDHDDQ